MYSPEDCRNALMSIFNEANMNSLNATCVARIISMMVRTHNSMVQSDVSLDTVVYVFVNVSV